jgi:short-subunit dehydrogenase
MNNIGCALEYSVTPGDAPTPSGRVINVGSVLGFIPAPYYASYRATKHALEGYSQTLDHAVRGFGILVISVEPGITRTSFDRNLVARDRPLTIYDSACNSIIETFTQLIQKGDKPEVVARVVLKTARAGKPRLRYPAGPGARQIALLRRVVPEEFFNILRKLNLPPCEIENTTLSKIFIVGGADHENRLVASS